MRSPSAPGIRHDVVLVGGGHAHVQVLKRWAMAPVPDARLTLVVDRPIAVYSGMVPGFVAGQYSREDLEIDLRPLALRAGARCIVAAATGVDPDACRLLLADRPPITYDTVSFDVGSTVAGLEIPGAREHAIPTRPIGEFVRRVDEVLAAARGREAFRVVVVGAGAGGVEVAFALAARLRAEPGRRVDVHVLEAGPRVLPGYAPSAARRVETAAAARAVTIRCGAPVARVEAHAVHLAGGERIAADATVWVAGAAALPIFTGSGLETDARGFVRIRPTLQCLGRDDVFAVGDCAAWTAGPALAKTGVYAVRQGPVLAHNLRARARGGRLSAYRPQRDFLSLLNLGDGRAIGTKWGVAVEGASLFSLKNWIDRRFVRRFQVLGPDDAVTPDFAASPMPGGDMLCGGCAAKVGESALTRALERLAPASHPAVILGLAQPDDAAAVETDRGEIVAATVDGFRAFSDDPYLVGRVAAINAVSDLWAKGVVPRFALAQVTVPDDEPARAEETLYQVMAGARAGLDADAVTLVGGHTTTGPELVVGFAVWGLALSPEALIRLGGLAPGDQLLLTKPLGTGVLLQADMRGMARGAWIEACCASMLRSNGPAARAAGPLRPSAATDVTGFGLAGHLGSMLRASKVSAALDLAALPALPGALSLLGRGVRSTAHPENAKARRAMWVDEAAARRPALDLLFDPQTSGGLLLGIAAERGEALLRALRGAGDPAAAIIGVVGTPRADGALIEVVARR
ncbi:MAG TPA: selenide, water dikinase SelD [Verrucomicrobiae bacterium]|jgi:selenide, water dikinase|nr:selenide, water dikinase SelD [Verrucomicrobiae bacterium]